MAGVAGAIGERFGIDSFFIRIGLVGLTLLLRPDSGQWLVLVTYLAAWLVLPGSTDRPLLFRMNQLRALQEIAAAFVCLILSLILLANQGQLVTVGLGGLALLLLGQPRSRRLLKHPTPLDEPSPVPGDSSATDQIDDPDLNRSQKQRQSSGCDPGGQAATPRFPLVRKRVSSRREPALWPLTMGLLVCWAVIALTLDQLMNPGLNPGLIVDGALLIIGSVLLLSHWRGRAKVTLLWLIPLLPFWLAFSAQDITRHEGAGARRHHPTAIPESGELRYSLGYGELSVNLQGLQLADDSTTTLTVDLTAGVTTIRIPTSMEVEVEVEVESRIGLGGTVISGLGPNETGTNYYGIEIGQSLSQVFPAWPGRCHPAWIGYEDLMGQVQFDDADNPTEFQSRDYWPEPTEVASALKAAGFVVTEVDSDYRQWRVETNTFGDVCRIEETASEPTSGKPPTIKIRSTIGLGTLEIYRV